MKLHFHGCGRESGHTRALSCSEVFLSQSPRWRCNPRLSYTFSLLYFPHIVQLLTVSLFNFELQVETINMSEDPQNQPMHWPCKFSMHHTLSRFSHSSRRVGLWFHFYFPFFEYFCLFYMLLLKIQLLDTFPFPRLVDIQLNRLIMWMVGLSIYFWECSTLVVGPSCVLSIEHPNGRLLPESFPHAEAQWWGLDDTGPTTAQEWCHRYFYFYFRFLICWCSFLF